MAVGVLGNEDATHRGVLFQAVGQVHGIARGGEFTGGAQRADHDEAGMHAQTHLQPGCAGTR